MTTYTVCLGSTPVLTLDFLAILQAYAGPTYELAIFQGNQLLGFPVNVGRRWERSSSRTRMATRPW